MKIKLLLLAIISMPLFSSLCMDPKRVDGQKNKEIWEVVFDGLLEHEQKSKETPQSSTADDTHPLIQSPKILMEILAKPNNLGVQTRSQKKYQEQKYREQQLILQCPQCGTAALKETLRIYKKNNSTTSFNESEESH